jgi:hypothetical protein
MTFEEALKRIIFRWWLIILIVATSTLVFFNWSNSSSYQSSIGVGISFNQEDFLSQFSGQPVPQSLNRGSEYVASLEEFSKYLLARFSSVEVQGLVSRRAELGIQNFDSKSPFYNVTTQNGGYVSISYETKDRQTGERFIQAIKETYNILIEKERKSGELSAFQVTPKTEFIENTASISRPVQFQLLPSVAGLLVAITIATLIPRKIKNNN